MPDERIQVNLRINKRLLTVIDERAARYKLSRNAWMELALERVASMPSQTTQKQERF